jgi:hypothetical protein
LKDLATEGNSQGTLTAKIVSKGRRWGELCWEKLAKGVSHIQLKDKTENELTNQIYFQILGKLTAIDNLIIQ